MKIKFVGAAGRVTGSCQWLVNEKTGIQFLVDCGLTQHGNFQTAINPSFPFEASQIAFVLLTHAHLDHCGRIPELFQKGFKGKIHCTKPTGELTKNHLLDLYKQELKKNTETPDCLLQLKEALLYIDEKPGFEWNRLSHIDEDLFVGFLRSSHLLGAVSVAVVWNTFNVTSGEVDKNSIFFSGDVGSSVNKKKNEPNPHLLLNDTMTPHRGADYIVMESTYGKEKREKKYQDFKERIKAIKSIITDDKFDTLIFPAFAMGRTQDILFDILYLIKKEELSNNAYNVYLDSPSAKKSTQIYLEALTKKQGKGYRYRSGEFCRQFFLSGEDEKEKSRRLVKDEKDQEHELQDEANNFLSKILKELCQNLKTQHTREYAETKYQEGNSQIHFIESKNIPIKPEKNKKQIIITTGGMFQGGPVIEHLQRLKNNNTAFVISGYQTQEIGIYLKKVANINEDYKVPRSFNNKICRIETKEIKGRIFDLSSYYSAHADCNGLLEFLFGSNYKPTKNFKEKHAATVFLNHGTAEKRHALSTEIYRHNQQNKDINVRSIAKIEIPYMDSPFFDLDKGKWEM